jgi:hypothetical protein
MVDGFPFRPIQLWLNGDPLVALFSGGFVFETGSVQRCATLFATNTVHSV